MLDEFEKEAESRGPELYMATVEQYTSAQGTRLRIDGQSEASGKFYRRLYSATVSAGSRVLVAKVSGTYVVLGRIV